jgi:hypothetical protein
MATQPKPAPKPKPDPKPDPNEPDEPEAAKAAAQQPPPVRTIADEQRERSDQIARQGVEKWKAERDERGPDDKPKQVPGVSPRVNDPGAPPPEGASDPGPPPPEGASWEGSTRSTPEARHAQNRAAP